MKRPLAVALCLLCCSLVQAAEFRFGAATVDITPAEPVALDGQRNARISKKPETPISVTALALEARDGDKVLDQTVIVSCDLVAIRDGILAKVRAKVKPRLPDFDVNKLFLGATHTHTAPVTLEGRYNLPATGIIQPAAYAEWMTERVADAVVQSWQKRQPGKVGWGQGHAVIAQNRRATYADGTAAMYGKTDVEKFRGIEGYEDHSLDVLFFWDAQDKLVATAINVPCPAQEVGGRSALNADFWHPVRERLRARHGKDLHVLAWTGAAGDQAPRVMFGSAADARMLKLRGLTRLEELGRRIVNGWSDAFEAAQKDKRANPVLQHRVKQIDLPLRKVTEAEAAEARKEAAKFAKDPAQRWNYNWNQSVVTRFELQKLGDPGAQKMELHVLRLGDVAIASNEFELFTDFGVQMKARSPAVQTFLIQLTGSAGYLPTERAVRGGGYSAVIQSSRVGPDGGQALVEQTVQTLKELWATK
ncbi:MAG: hypothetical protein AB1705_10390 [Verrucomicrobiota bacterium]